MNNILARWHSTERDVVFLFAKDVDQQHGFTLIEMAMVLLIVGLLVGGGLAALGPVIDTAKRTQTKSNMDQIEYSLMLFVIRNNRLPCPADGNCRSDGTNCPAANPPAVPSPKDWFGLEQPATGSPAACPVPVTNSIVPWKSLDSNAVNYATDGWGQWISYIPANPTVNVAVSSLVDTTAPSPCPAYTAYQAGTVSFQPTCTACLSRTTGIRGNDSNLYSTRATYCDSGLVPSYPYGAYIPVYTGIYTGTGPKLTVETTTGANPTPVTALNVATAGNRAAYVLISHGPSGYYGWNKAGIQLSPPAIIPTFKADNNTGTVSGVGTAYGFVQAPQNIISGVSLFDDIVRWKSPGFIIQQCGGGSCGNP